MKKNSTTFLFSCIFLFLTIILYRNFLYSYRMQLENFLPYYNYQNQILYYLTGDLMYDIKSPMNLRFLGLIIQYLIFKLIPCIELTNLNSDLTQTYTCATYSNALMNYLSMTSFLSLIFIYSHKKLKLNLTTSVLSLLLSYIFFIYLEAFTLDRISVLYLLIILYFLDNKKISLLLILLSCLVNEKIIIVVGIYFFIRAFIYNEKKYLIYFFSSLLSFILVLAIFIFYSFILNYGYFGQNDPSGIYNTIFSEGIMRLKSIFLNPKGISNALLPIIFSISPYIYLLFSNKKKKSIEILIPLSLIFFGMGGGTTNIGRYVMYSMPLWIPIMSYIIFVNIDKLIKSKN